MPAFIKLDGVDGEVDAAHSAANWELTVKVLDSGTFYGAMTNVELAITVTDTETGNGAPGTERTSGLIYSGESGGLNSDPVGPSDVAAGSTAQAGGHAKWIETESWTWGDAGSGHASHGTGGGGAGKVSVHDVSLSTSVPKAAAGEIEIDAGHAPGSAMQELLRKTLEPAQASASDAVELVEMHFSLRQIEIEHGGDLGMEAPAAADADTSALGNTYLGVTTIEQGVLEATHSSMSLSFAYYMA